jgi:hypothetical protein
MSLERLIIFTRYPHPGKAKTRLIPALGAEGAAQLHRQMTEHTLTQVRSWVKAGSRWLEIWFSGAATDQQAIQDWLGADRVYRLQGGGDLGDRMKEAFEAAFAAGMERVVIIGTDCPELDAKLLLQAFQALQTQDVVLGEATDGGYYLIGLRRLVPELLTGIDWGTDRVLQQTLERAKAACLSLTLLPPLADIDRPEDLAVWERIQARQPPQISVIIPVLNEAKTIQSVLRTLRSSSLPDADSKVGVEAASLPQDSLTNLQEFAANQFLESEAIERIEIEILVVDGGSQDETRSLAQRAGATVIDSMPGRACQMNTGATVAQGEILLFLHADTQIPADFVAQVKATLAQPGVVAGAFELKIAGKGWGLRWVEWGVKWRSRLLQLPYGDQAIFLRATTFRQVGGFPDLPIMEDFVLVRSLQKMGKVAIASASVITSARRWQKLGVLRTTLINQLIIWGYFCGIAPERLADLYHWAKVKQRAE